MDGDKDPRGGVQFCDGCREPCWFGIEAVSDAATYCWDCGLEARIVGVLWGENPDEERA